jgi:hypothetical protein
MCSAHQQSLLCHATLLSWNLACYWPAVASWCQLLSRPPARQTAAASQLLLLLLLPLLCSLLSACCQQK